MFNKDDYAFRWIRILEAGARQETRGWVPINCVEIGLLEPGQKVGQWKVHLSRPSPYTQVDVTVNAGNSQLYRAMTTL